MFGFSLRAGVGRLVVLLLLCQCLTLHAAPADVKALAAAATVFLHKHVGSDGQVDYRAIKRSPAELQGLLKQVQTLSVQPLSAAEKKAFYLNAYNLTVIGAVVESYPLTSVMKVPGFFDKQQRVVAGEKMTLNELENNKLRTPYNDPRVHFALVCAAKGCPRLSQDAYTPATLEAQLTAQAQRVLQDPTFIRVQEDSKKVLVSEIFKWYEADFKATGKPLLGYINQFRAARLLPAGLAVEYYTYDWALNEGRR
ncbi:DUF547 domain-containing protein [Hymenobacter metallicola]|uniref:DUF547 domain-containing protein n=1 Tax=Hymenobacter metallicola TaxID=2563114 RepID=A0A4Z0QFU0_9BACT|nr:DUF547 domain-containing protein [Hymenobacter metallicola]TGE28908.1 DUF547 domain-containing protein [Hymenobacter metallicola]